MTKKPNIILLISGQWSARMGDGSGDNFGPIQTPAIDRLAAEGIRFTQSYASFPLCCAARASIFSGMMPHKHRILTNKEVYKDKYGQEFKILFHLALDPDETTSRFLQPGYVDISLQARRRLDCWLQEQNFSLTIDPI